MPSAKTTKSGSHSSSARHRSSSKSGASSLSSSNKKSVPSTTTTTSTISSSESRAKQDSTQRSSLATADNGANRSSTYANRDSTTPLLTSTMSSKPTGPSSLPATASFNKGNINNPTSANEQAATTTNTNFALNARESITGTNPSGVVPNSYSNNYVNKSNIENDNENTYGGGEMSGMGEKRVPQAEATTTMMMTAPNSMAPFSGAQMNNYNNNSKVARNNNPYDVQRTVAGNQYGPSYDNNNMKRESMTGSFYDSNNNNMQMNMPYESFGQGEPSNMSRGSQIGSAFGSMGPSGFGSAARGGSMYGMGSNYGSMYGTGANMNGMNGSNVGPMSGFGSMYGANGNAPPFGSMYGGYGSMYGGAGGPMMMPGSMYGPYGSMYGMGGNMYGNGMSGRTPSSMMMMMPYGGNSLYGGMMPNGMGSMYGRLSSFASYGGLSMYGSQFGSFNSLANSSMHSIGGLWAPPSMYKSVRRPHHEILVRAKQLTEQALEGNDKDEDDGDNHKNKDNGKLTNGASADKDRAAQGETGKVDNANQKMKIIASNDAANVNKSLTADKATKPEKIELGNPSTVVVLTESAATSSRVVADKNEDKLSIQDGKTDSFVHFLTSEVLTWHDAIAPLEKNSNALVFTDILNNVAAGHNTALIFVNKDNDNIVDTKNNNSQSDKASTNSGNNLGNAPVMGKIAFSLLQKILQNMTNDESVKRWRLYCTCAVLTSALQLRDVMQSSSSSSSSSSKTTPPLQEIKIGSNPIYGMCLLDLTSQTIDTIKEGEKYFQKVLVTEYAREETLVIQTILMQEKNDFTLLSSFTIVGIKDVGVAEAIAIADDRRVAAPFYKTIVGGPCRSAIITVITGEKNVAEAEVNSMRAMMLLGTRPNLTPRSGNVARFVTYTEDQIIKFNSELPKLSETAKDKMEQTISMLRLMVNDAKQIQSITSTEPPKAYPVQNKAADHELNENQKAILSDPTKDKGISLDKTNTSDNKNNTLTAVESEEPGIVGTIKRMAGNAIDAIASTISARPFQSIHRLVVFVDADEVKTSKTCNIKVNNEVKAFDVDECLTRTSPIMSNDEVISSSELERLTRVFCAGYNVSIISAECITSVTPQKQFTWHAVRQMLTALFTSPNSTFTINNSTSTSTSAEKREIKELASITIQLSMSVVCNDELIVDLLSPSARTISHVDAQPISVVSSPLFGPIVNNVTRRELHSVKEMNATINSALNAASLHTKNPNSVIIANAVVKQITEEKDVMVCALFAAVGNNTQPFTSVVEKKDKAPRYLYMYALGGPSSTLIVVTAQQGANQEQSVSALNGQCTLARVRTSGNRDGSVRDFVKYATNSLEKAHKALQEASNSKDKAHAERNVKRLEQSLKDYTELLENPTTTSPAVYAVEGNETISSHHLIPNNNTKNVEVALSENTSAIKDANKTNQRNVNDSNKSNDQSSTTAKSNTGMKPRTMMSEAPSTSTLANNKNNNAGSNEVKVVEEAHADGNTVDGQSSAQNKSNDKDNNNNNSSSIDTSAKDNDKDEDGATSKTPIKFIAVVTEQLRSGLTGKEGWNAINTDESNKLIITNTEQNYTYEVDEVIVRERHNSSIRSHTLDELREEFMSGYNVAILTADAKGSTASLEMIDRTVRSILGKLQPNMELFMSLCALHERESTVYDTLKEDDSFKLMQLSASPIFGPCISNVTFNKINSVEAFVKMMSSGLRFCGEHRACVILQLVLCRVEKDQKDVIVSSMLGVMCPGDVYVYRKALESSVKERGILQLALGGACHTVFACGLTRNPVDDSCLAIANTSQIMRANRNSKLRSGSMKRFIYHTKLALEQARKSIESAKNEDEKKRLVAYETNVSNMLTEAEKYVDDPLGKIPPSYVKEIHHEL